MADIQFHALRRPQPGGQGSGPATTKPNREHAQEGVHSNSAPRLPMAAQQHEEEGNNRHYDIGHRTEHTSMSHERLLEKLED